MLDKTELTKTVGDYNFSVKFSLLGDGTYMMSYSLKCVCREIDSYSLNLRGSEVKAAIERFVNENGYKENKQHG